MLSRAAGTAPTARTPAGPQVLLQVGDRRGQRRGPPAESTARTLRRSAPRCSKKNCSRSARNVVQVGPERRHRPRAGSPRRPCCSSRSIGTRTATPASGSASARIRRMPCAWRRSPNGSRDPVGRSPARNRPTSVSSLSASDTAAHVTRAAPSAAAVGAAVGLDGDGQIVVVNRLPHGFRLAGLARVDPAHHALELGELAHHVGREVGLREPRGARRGRRPDRPAA